MFPFRKKQSEPPLPLSLESVARALESFGVPRKLAREVAERVAQARREAKLAELTAYEGQVVDARFRVLKTAATGRKTVALVGDESGVARAILDSAAEEGKSYRVRDAVVRRGAIVVGKGSRVFECSTVAVREVRVRGAIVDARPHGGSLLLTFSSASGLEFHFTAECKGDWMEEASRLVGRYAELAVTQKGERVEVALL